MRCHVLYVEDDEGVRNAITRSLRFADYDVFAASTVEEAALALKTFEFDVVVSDWNLGGGSTGAEVYALAKAHQPSLASRFMFLSSETPHLDDHVIWVEKPAHSSEILRVVAELAARRQTAVGGSRS